MDLLSLVLTLRPLAPTPADKPLPLWWGRAAHALLLDILRQHNDVLANALHDSPDAPRPFSVSNLLGYSSRNGLQADTSYILRLTAIQKEIAEILWGAARDGRLSANTTIDLDYLPFRIEAVQPAPGGKFVDQAENPASPWAGMNTYQELSAPYLLSQVEAPRQISLQFTSPVTFKSGGKHVPLPLPELVFGSLLERWNAFAPIVFPPEVKRYASECLAVSRYRLSSRVAPMKSGGIRVGGVGEVTYTTLNYDRYWMSVICVLAEFALYSGVGAGVGMGLGQCRRKT